MSKNTSNIDKKNKKVTAANATTKEIKSKENNKTNKSATIKKLWGYLKFNRIFLIFSMLCALISVLTELYIPVLTGRAIDFIVEAGKVDFDGLKGIFVSIFIFMGISGISKWFMNLCNNRLTYDTVRRVREEGFAKIKKLPLKYVDKNGSGDILSRIIADVDQMADGLLMGFSQFFTGVTTIFATLIFMLMVNPVITVVVVVVTPLSLIVASKIAKSSYDMFKKQSETRGEQTKLVEEEISSISVVQAFSKEEDMIREYDEINEKLGEYSLKATFFSSLTNPCTRFVNNVVYALVGFVGAMYAVAGGISVGQLTCFLSYANQYTKPFNEISGVITELQNALACAERVFELMEEDEETEAGREGDSITADGHVSLENVEFSYTEDKPLIRNFNLDVKPGQRIAIVGPTGCGKTTMINLLMRFYDVDSGSIRIGVEGQTEDNSELDIRDINRQALRLNYGMVLQETWLRKGTIAENIAMGKPDATMEEIVEAAKKSHAHSFIKRLPDGYDTEIAEDGGNLSQGQKQLLCITRVMLNLPPMLILDEATSSIDTMTEERIQRAFNKMMVGRTSFIVAHRLSTIEEADVILVMKDGNIIEQGSHKELLKQNGFYKELYYSQYSY